MTKVLKGITRSMAPAGLKSALSFEAVRSASRERVQQRLPPGLRAADGGSVGGGAGRGCLKRHDQCRRYNSCKKLLVKLGLLGSPGAVPRQHPNSQCLLVNPGPRFPERSVSWKTPEETMSSLCWLCSESIHCESLLSMFEHVQRVLVLKCDDFHVRTKRTRSP